MRKRLKMFSKVLIFVLKSLILNIVDRSFDAHGIMDLEPRYTFRGHKGPVLSMDMSSTGEAFFTGGHDGNICCWEVLFERVVNN